MIFRYFVMVLMFSIIFLSGIVENTYAVSVVAVTDSGSSFLVEFGTSDTSSNSTSSVSSNATSILDGLCVSLAIQNINTNGKVYFGSGNNPGSQTDIRQYVGIGANDDWAIAITDDDSYEVLVIPEFKKEYSYSSGSLLDVTSTHPNILGYSNSQSISGAPSISLGNDEITISGTGTVVMKLNSYSNDMLIRGTLSNADVKLVTSPLDLTTISMSGNDYVLYENTSPTKTQIFHTIEYKQKVCRGGCTGYVEIHTYGFEYASYPNLLVA